MNRYTARVMVEYVFDVEADSEESAKHYAYYNFSNYDQYSDVYSTDIYLEDENIYA